MNQRTLYTRFFASALLVLLGATGAAAQDAAPPLLELAEPAPDSTAEPEPVPPPPPPDPDPTAGPPPGAIAEAEENADWYEDSGDSEWWYEEKDGLFPDLSVGHGWDNKAYMLAVGRFNLYYLDEGESLGAHVRLLGLGGLRFAKRVIEMDGGSTLEAESTFMMQLFETGVRIHYAGPAYLAFGLSIGAAFYDGLVPEADGFAGLGFQISGWGVGPK